MLLVWDEIWGRSETKTFFSLEITVFLRLKVHYLAAISSHDLFFLEITLNLGRKLVLNTMIFGLKIRISHRIFFLPVKYCMSYSLTTHKITDCMTRFRRGNCMTSLRGHRKPLAVVLNLWHAYHAEICLIGTRAVFEFNKIRYSN